MKWNDGLSWDCSAAIEQAAEQWARDEEYEDDEEGHTVAETIGDLRNLERLAEALIALVGQLSPVGKAAMFEAGERRRTYSRDPRRGFKQVYTGRYALSSLSDKLEEIALSANQAADQLHEMHSPTAELEGQGAGSAMGRDSDLRAITIDHDRNAGLPPFRSPKDKFAVRTIKALVRDGFDPKMVGARRALRERLDAVWVHFAKSDPPNWDRVIKQRDRISAWVGRELDAERIWKEVQARNGSSKNSGRCPPGQRASYVVAPDQPGDSHVDVESEGRRRPHGPECEHPQ